MKLLLMRVLAKQKNTSTSLHVDNFSTKHFCVMNKTKQAYRGTGHCDNNQF